MKIAIACQQGHLSSDVAPKFGRAPYYMIYDTEQSASSPSAKAGRPPKLADGGLEAAVTLLNDEINAVIAGEFGEHVTHFLHAANVKMARAPQAAGSWALEQFLHDRLPLV